MLGKSYIPILFLDTSDHVSQGDQNSSPAWATHKFVILLTRTSGYWVVPRLGTMLYSVDSVPVRAVPPVSLTNMLW